MNIQYLTKRDKLNSVSVFLLALCALAVYTPFNLVGIWIILPFIFICTLIKNGGLANVNTTIYILILFLSLLSCLFAYNIDIAFSSLFSMLTGFVGYFCFYSLSKNIKNIPYLYAVYILYYIGMWWFVINNMGINNIDITTTRLGEDEDGFNANDISYMTFYFNAALWIIYVLSYKFSNKNTFGIIFIIGFTVLSFITATLFASRQVLLIEIPFIFGLLFIKFIKGQNNTLRKWATVISVILIIILLYAYIGKDIFTSSLLFSRYENIEEDSRLFLMNKAFEVGLNNPIFGVGCGNFMYYSGLYVFSHCSYTELFANSGLLTACIYMFWALGVIFIQIKRYHKTNSNIFIYLALVCFMWFLSNFFFVFYINVWLMGFWGLVLGTSDSIYNKIRLSR